MKIHRANRAPLYFVASALWFLVNQGNPQSLFSGIVATFLLLIGFFNWIEGK